METQQIVKIGHLRTIYSLRSKTNMVQIVHNQTLSKLPANMESSRNTFEILYHYGKQVYPWLSKNENCSHQKECYFDMKYVDEEFRDLVLYPHQFLVKIEKKLIAELAEMEDQ